MDSALHHAYRGFVTLKGPRLRRTPTRVVHVAFCDDGVFSHDDPLVQMELNDVLACGRLDPSADLVRRMLTQLSTYDHTRHVMIAVVFDRQTVLSDVLHCPA